MFDFLDALNNACFEYAYKKTAPHTDKWWKVIERYRIRRLYINKLRCKYYKGFKRG